MGQKNLSNQYNDKSFQKKVDSVPSSVGSKVLRQALTLYVLLKDKDVPKWVKVSIVGVLGYFIFPLDLIPDFLPGGYIDDIAMMAGAARQLYVYTTPEILAKVKDLMPEWAKEKGINV